MNEIATTTTSGNSKMPYTSDVGCDEQRLTQPACSSAITTPMRSDRISQLYSSTMPSEPTSRIVDAAPPSPQSWNWFMLL